METDDLQDLAFMWALADDYLAFNWEFVKGRMDRRLAAALDREATQ